jgi:hypothetical protein
LDWIHVDVMDGGSAIFGADDYVAAIRANATAAARL